MRERWRAGRLAELDVADIFLVIDNFPVLRADFETSPTWCRTWPPAAPATASI